MNLYCTLNQIKSAGTLGITGTDYDSQILRNIGVASRLIDKESDRFFYTYEGSFYQDGGANRVVLDWDVQTITSLIVDIDGLNQYPTTSAYTVDMNSPTTAPDAFAYPTNTLPKTRLEANPFGSYGHLGAGFRRAIKITGTFGYGNDWPAPNTADLGTILSADTTSTATALTVSTGGFLSAGMTLKIDSEQIYVSATNSTGSTGTMARAQNGTTAGTHASSSAISCYQYPEAITQAAVITTIRSWKRRESGYVNTVINTDMGTFMTIKGIDPDVAATIKNYKRLRIPSYL